MLSVNLSQTMRHHLCGLSHLILTRTSGANPTIIPISQTENNTWGFSIGLVCSEGNPVLKKLLIWEEYSSSKWRALWLCLILSCFPSNSVSQEILYDWMNMKAYDMWHEYENNDRFCFRTPLFYFVYIICRVKHLSANEKKPLYPICGRVGRPADGVVQHDFAQVLWLFQDVSECECLDLTLPALKLMIIALFLMTLFHNQGEKVNKKNL